MQRVQNGPLARILHNSLYQRLLNFCEQYTPEFPGEPVVAAWMTRLYNNDDRLHILVRLAEDSYRIIGHAVIEVQEAYNQRVVFCHQVQGDKVNLADIDEGAEYIDKLVAAVGAHCSVLYTAKSAKAYEKRYGYKTMLTMMVKCNDDDTHEQ